jgi:hypothetical protein
MGNKHFFCSFSILVINSTLAVSRVCGISGTVLIYLLGNSTSHCEHSQELHSSKKRRQKEGNELCPVH